MRRKTRARFTLVTARHTRKTCSFAWKRSHSQRRFRSGNRCSNNSSGNAASEIGDTVSAIAGEAGFCMEYSTNEIVAVEVAVGAANRRARESEFWKIVEQITKQRPKNLYKTGKRKFLETSKQ